MKITSTNAKNQMNLQLFKKLKRANFSLIELLTVIVVILILMTLAIPNVHQIRKKSKSIICANQLKQLGTLLRTYANDNNGYLPYSRNSPSYGRGTYSYNDRRLGRLYGLWSGHLLPYFNVDLPSWDKGDFYHDKARAKNISGRRRIIFQENLDDIDQWASVANNENSGNWKLLHDMFYEGGYGSLKTFICPEAVTTFNAHALTKNRYIPRVSGILPPTSGLGLYGLPSSYLGNGQLFQTKRLEDVNRSNFLLLEGCDQFSQDVRGLMTPVNFTKYFSGKCAYGGGVNNIIYGWSPWTQNPASAPPPTSASFMHDDTKEIWSSWQAYMPISSVNQYNKIFSPFSIASYIWDRPEYKQSFLLANKYPGEKWENYEAPFTKGRFKIYRYYSEDHQPSSMFGKMNILTVDLSVKSSHMGWLYENGRTLGQNTE